MFTPNKLGEDDEPKIDESAYFSDGKKFTNQLTTDLPVWSCRQVRVRTFCRKNHLAESEKVRLNRPPNREGLWRGEGHDIKTD